MPQPTSPILEALRLVMIADAHRVECLGILISCSLEGKRDSSFTPWREVVHSANINTFIQPSLYTKQDKLLFPFEDAFNGWRLIADDYIARRLTSDDKIQVTGVLDFVNGSNSIADTKIVLNTNLTELTNYYTKTETNTSLALNAPLVSPTFTGNISTAGDITGSNAIATTISANKSLVLQQIGDLYGTTRMALQYRSRLNGLSIQTNSATTTLTDLL